jgi:hypothetical protein
MMRSKELRLLATLAAALCALPAGAQAPSLGKGQTSGKLLTKAELKACITQQDALKGRRDEVERTGTTLQKDKAEIEQLGEALNADKANVDASNEEAVNAYNARVRGRDQRIDEWNGRNATAVEQAKAWQADSDRWRNECASRPYREDDEKALRRGK